MPRLGSWNPLAREWRYVRPGTLHLRSDLTERGNAARWDREPARCGIAEAFTRCGCRQRGQEDLARSGSALAVHCDKVKASRL
jgi:hypothetical protein